MARFESLKGEQKTGAFLGLLADSILGCVSSSVVLTLLFALLAYGFGLFSVAELKNAGTLLVGHVLSGQSLWDETRLHFFAPEGVTVVFTVAEFERIQAEMSASVQRLWSVLFVCGVLGVIGAVGLWFLYRRFAVLGLFGRDQSALFLRGGIRVSEVDLRKLLNKSRRASDLQVGQLPFLRDSENRHFLVAGDTGAGKSQAIMQLLDGIRARGEKVFVYDPSGDFTKHFYREGQDVLLAPFDARSVNWTPFCEGEDYAELERIALSFCPPGVSGETSKHWDDSANTIFASLLFSIVEDPLLSNTNESVLRAIATKTKRIHLNELGQPCISFETTLNRLLAGTLADGLINPESPTHRSDVVSTLIPKIRSLQYLLGLEDRDLFSITDWVNAASDSWVFVRVNENQLKLSQALITAWVDTLVTSVLSRNPDPEHRIWLVTDETQGLARIGSLYDAVEKGRKYNFACVLGFTSHRKMEQIYGEKMMSSILSSLSTKLCYRYSDPSASEWVSKLLGEEEVIEGRTSLGRAKESSVSEQEDKRRNALVLPTEIQNLEDLKCYVKMPGNLPITCVKTSYTKRAVVADYWVKRKLSPPIVAEETVINELNKGAPLKKTEKVTEPYL